MLKKHFAFLLFLMLAVATATAGTWKMHSYYVTSKIQNVYDTGDKIYYLNGGNLFRFDKTTLQTDALNKQNVLSDNSIKQIYYDADNNCLFIAYASANIDAIDSEGKVHNISNIKDIVPHVRDYTLSDGQLTSYVGKTIKDITFANGVAYVAIGFGYATIDEATMRLTKFYELGQKLSINSVTMVGDLLVITTDKYCYYGDPSVEDPIKNFNKKSGTFDNSRLFPVDDQTALCMRASALSKLDFSGGGAPTMTSVISEATSSLQKTATGFIANCSGKKYYYTIDPTGTTATKVTLSAVGFATMAMNGDGSIWINDATGLHLSGSSTAYKINAMTTTEPYWLKYNADLDRLYVGVSGPKFNVNSNAVSIANVVNYYDGEEWTNASYTAAGAGYAFKFNPQDSHTYVRSSWDKGIFKITDDAKKLTYTKSNSMIGTYVPHPAFDNYGNMWTVSSYGNASCPVAVLPAEKTLNNTVTKADWFQPSGLLTLNTNSMQAANFLVSSKNNVKIFCDCDMYQGAIMGRIYCWDNFSPDYSVDNYQVVGLNRFVDQHNSLIEWIYLIHFEEDNDGLIWVGHTTGLFAFDPDGVFDEYPKGIRPYVEKFSEGKGYLCEGYSVYDIGVDRDNNKWIASSNGVYFVSPDGSEVYNHFTTENSDIPSDLVYSIECDTVHDRVYIYTDNGFAEYIVHGDAASLNFDDVYAFPNPVEPDFTGMVKIAGLMDNAYVTITDREGNIVTQIGPVTGSALWDCSDENGERVPTGIYNVYAAQDAAPAPEGTPHTTIMVIK